MEVRRRKNTKKRSQFKVYSRHSPLAPRLVALRPFRISKKQFLKVSKTFRNREKLSAFKKLIGRQFILA
jgi:hypothetical protein